MSLVEEYYELNEAENVSSLWKVLQIACCVFAGGFGLAAGFTMALVRLKFNDRCYLFTEVKISHAENCEKEHKIVNWESDTWCDYYQFTMVSSFVVAIIWATLFLMCGKGGKSLTGLPQPWRIVWPSLVFNLIYFAIVLGTAIRIQQGTDHFCRRKQFQTKSSKFLQDYCEPLKLLLKSDVQKTSVLLDVVLKSSWGCAASWFLLFLLAFCRILFVIDFQLYKICVFKIDESLHKKGEEIIKITSYEEPKLMTSDENDEVEITPKTEKNFKPEQVANKFLRRHQTSQNRSPMKQTSALYVEAHIRKLNLERNRQTCLTVLDEAFGSSDLRGELKKSGNIPPNSDSSAKAEIRKLLNEKYKHLYFNEDENEIGSTSTFNKLNLNDDAEVFSREFPSNHLLKFKKQV